MFKHTLVEFDELETITEDKKRFYLTPEGNKYHQRPHHEVLRCISWWKTMLTIKT